MAKVKVEVLRAVVDGHGEGEVIEVDSKSADMLEKNGYVKKVKEAKKQEKKDDKDEDDKK